MKNKINKATSKIKSSKTYRYVKENKKKVVGVTLSIFMVFIFTFTMYNLNNPTYFNKLFASIIGEAPANSAFKDKDFYNCIIDTYNRQNSASKAYTDNLTDEEFLSITSLDCSGKYIEDASGIEKLTNLTSLNLSYNNLTSIDLSKNTLLAELDLAWNSLTSIDLSNNTLLTSLDVGSNLTSIDLNNNTALKSLFLYSHNITNIDLSNNTALESLELCGNNLTSIDLSNNTLLTELRLDSNNLTSIDLSRSIYLESLDLRFNNLTSIDLSENKTLKSLKLSVNSTNIDLSNNTALESLELYGYNLTSIDLSNNTLLTSLAVGSNLTSIDLSENKALESLKLSGNNLTNIDLSNNTLLTELNLYNTNFFNYDAYPGETFEIDDSKIKLPEGKSFTYSKNDYSNNGNIDGKKVTLLDGASSFYFDVKLDDNVVATYNVYVHDFYYVDSFHFEEICKEENFILLMDINKTKKLSKEDFNSSVGDIVLKDNKLEIVRDNKVIATYNIGILDVSGFLEETSSDEGGGNFIITVNDVNDVKEPIINTTNCEYEYKDNKINVIYNGKTIYSFSLINIYADKKYLIRYNYWGSDYAELTFFTENFDESLINNIADIEDIDKDKINIINAEFKYVEDLEDGWPGFERNLEINVNGEYLCRILTLSMLSNNYDLTKDYIYLGDKKFNNDFYMKGIEGIIPNEELEEDGYVIKVLEDSVSFWDYFEYHIYDPTDEEADEDGYVYKWMPYLKLKEWKFIKVTSEEYDLSSDEIDLKNTEIDLSKINVTNALLKVENDKLLVMYGDEVVKEFKLKNRKVITTTITSKKEETTTKKESTTNKKTTTKKESIIDKIFKKDTTTKKETTTTSKNNESNVTTTSSSNIENSTKNSKTNIFKKSTIKTTTKVEENSISNKIKNGIRMLNNISKPMIILLGLIGIILLVYIIILLNKKNKEEEK